jgi:FkbM family methyltransferase
LNKQKPDDFTNFKIIWFFDPDKWIEYYQKNYTVIEQKLNNLKAGLDEQSKELADLLHSRRSTLQVATKYREHVRYNTQTIFTNAELEQQRQQMLFMQEYLKTVDDAQTNPKLYWEKSVFATDSGMLEVSPDLYDYVKGKDFIDGGAWYGDSALMFSKYLPSKIYAFEPMSETFKGLQHTIETKPELKDICVPIQNATGEHQSSIDFYFFEGGSNLHTDSLNAPKETIRVIKLDDFITENNINLGLLKLDVEGSEFGTIKGALESIKKFRPVLLISIYHMPEDFFEIKPLLEKELDNYKFKIRKLSPFDPAADFTLIGEPYDAV